MEKRLYQLLKNDKNNICPICREYQEQFEDCLFLNCGHLHCKKCFIEYEKIYNHCSVCRSSFTFKNLPNALLIFFEQFSIQHQFELHDIMNLYFNIDLIIMKMLNSCPKWESDISQSHLYFQKENIDLFIKKFIQLKN